MLTPLPNLVACRPCAGIAHISDLTVSRNCTRQHPSLVASSPFSFQASTDLTCFFPSLVSCKESSSSAVPHEQLRPSHCALRNMPAPICDQVQTGRPCDAVEVCDNLLRAIMPRRKCLKWSPDLPAISSSNIRAVGTSAREHVGCQMSNAMLG